MSTCTRFKLHVMDPEEILSELTVLLKPLETNWYSLGIQLKINKFILDRIEANHKLPGGVQRCLAEVISHWKNDVIAELDPSWSEKLVNAVERVSAGELEYSNVVKSIRKQFPAHVDNCTSDAGNRKKDEESGYGQIRRSFSSLSTCNSDHEVIPELPPTTASSSTVVTDSDADSGYRSSSNASFESDQCHAAARLDTYSLSPGCGCGECNIHKMCAEGCPRPDHSKRLPILTKFHGGETASESTSKILSGAPQSRDHQHSVDSFERSTSNLCQQYGRLVLDTKNSFDNQQVKTGDVALYLLNSFPLLKGSHDEITNADDMTDLFTKVTHRACSWFNFDIIRSLIKVFGSEEDSQRLAEYERNFETFLKQRLPQEMTHFELGSKTGVIGSKTLFIKVDREWASISIGELERLCGEFARTLETDRKNIYLADVNKGCIALTLLIPEEIANNLSERKLTRKQKQMLSSERVVRLSCGKLKWSRPAPKHPSPDSDSDTEKKPEDESLCDSKENKEDSEYKLAMAQQHHDRPTISFSTIHLIKTQTLGSGTYGSVCKALCADSLLCAAKIIHTTLIDPNAHLQIERHREHRLPISRFMQECEFMSAIRHPNIVQYLGMHQDPQIGQPVLLMELMDDSLTHFLESSQDAVPYHIQVKFCHDITLANSYLHSNGIIHRDLSSNNVLLRGNVQAKVTDFGTAKLHVREPNHQAPRSFLTMCPGADVYMPPEAVKDPPEYNKKIDCFSIGALIVQILTRHFPAPGDCFQVHYAQIPYGPANVPVPEIERRQNHISQVDPNHPLLPVALDCLRDSDVDRPSAQELYRRVAALKETPQFTESMRRAQETPVQGATIVSRNRQGPRTPETGDKTKKDTRIPHGTVYVPVAEIERRQNNISQVDPNHPLLPIALDCLRDNGDHRPSAQELCRRVAALKETTQFTESMRRAQETPVQCATESLCDSKENKEDSEYKLIATKQGELMMATGDSKSMTFNELKAYSNISTSSCSITDSDSGSESVCTKDTLPSFSGAGRPLRTIPVDSPKEISRGDHICYIINDSKEYRPEYRSALVEDVSEENITVIVYTPEGVQQITREFSLFKSLHKVDYTPDATTIDMAVRNAQKRLGESRYHALFNNSHHFVTKAKTGLEYSMPDLIHALQDPLSSDYELKPVLMKCSLNKIEDIEPGDHIMDTSDQHWLVESVDITSSTFTAYTTSRKHVTFTKKQWRDNLFKIQYPLSNVEPSTILQKACTKLQQNNEWRESDRFVTKVKWGRAFAISDASLLDSTCAPLSCTRVTPHVTLDWGDHLLVKTNSRNYRSVLIEAILDADTIVCMPDINGVESRGDISISEQEVYRVNYSQHLPPGEIISRAESKEGQQLLKSCQYDTSLFVSWAVSGRSVAIDPDELIKNQELKMVTPVSYKRVTRETSHKLQPGDHLFIRYPYHGYHWHFMVTKVCAEPNTFKTIYCLRGTVKETVEKVNPEESYVYKVIYEEELVPEEAIARARSKLGAVMLSKSVISELDFVRWAKTGSDDGVNTDVMTNVSAPTSKSSITSFQQLNPGDYLVIEEDAAFRHCLEESVNASDFQCPCGKCNLETEDIMTTQEHTKSEIADQHTSISKPDASSVMKISEIFDRVVKSVQSHVCEFAAKAFSKRLISANHQSQATNHSLGEYQRAYDLLQVIMSRIEENNAHFDSFVTILEEVKLTQLASELKRAAYPTIELPDTKSSGDSDSGTTIAAESVNASGFQCLCGNCNIESYFRDPSKCPRLQETSFPLLNTSHLSKDKKETLEHQLINDINRQIRGFTDDSQTPTSDSETPPTIPSTSGIPSTQDNETPLTFSFADDIETPSPIPSTDDCETPPPTDQLSTDYAEALQLGKLLVAYARLVMIGPGGIGKTSLLNGLKNIPLLSANSTQLAETSTVGLQNLSRAIEDPENPWKEVPEDDETGEKVSLVQRVKNATSEQKRSACYIGTMKAAAGASIHHIMRHRGTQSQSGRVFQNKAMQIADEISSRAVRVGMENPNAQAPESEVMLHVWDCGGQPVFLDVLPPFLTSRSMFMLIFDASKNLHEECIATSHKDGAVVQSEQYHNTTIMEFLLQWMATIHANLAKQDNADTNEEHVPKFPCILPIGTHGDLPSVQSHKEKILQEISSECENKAFGYLVRPGVIVDNTKAGAGSNEDPAFKQVLKEAYNFVNENLKIPTPITWVHFRKAIKNLAATKPIISLEEVIELAKACGIREEAVGSVLKFYHELAVFFHYAHIPSLKNYVIADLQWLINQLAKVLALEGFEDNGSSLLWKPLLEKGIFVQPLCEEVWKGSKLPPQALLDLMENFLLFAQIHSKVYPQHPGREYFIPSVLKPFNPGEDTTTEANARKKVAPLHLTFNTSYVPPGFFCRLVTLLTKEPKCDVLFKHEVYRNRISILYGGVNSQIDKIIISQLPCSIKVEVSREQPRLSHHPLFSSTCQEVLKLIQECSVTVLEWWPGIKVSPAFICEQSSSDEGHPPHFTKFQPDATTRSSLLCENFHPATLPTRDQQYWLKVSLNEEGMGGSLLTPSELNHLVALVPQAKIKELAECLEMTIHLTSEDPTSLHTVLSRWTKELQDMNVTHVRPHLVHYLRMSGLQELAEKLKYGELRASDATTTTSIEAPQDPCDYPDHAPLTRRASSTFYFTKSGRESKRSEGWLYKRGKVVKNWKRRWFILDLLKNELSYYDSKQDSKCHGTIHVRDIHEVYEGESQVVPLLKPGKQGYFFNVVTPKRVYYLMALNDSDRTNWMAAIKTAISLVH